MTEFTGKLTYCGSKQPFGLRALQRTHSLHVLGISRNSESSQPVVFQMPELAGKGGAAPVGSRKEARSVHTDNYRPINMVHELIKDCELDAT